MYVAEYDQTGLRTFTGTGTQDGLMGPLARLLVEATWHNTLLIGRATDLTIDPFDRATRRGSIAWVQSISIACLLLSALADAPPRSLTVDADDVRAMRDSLAKLGVGLSGGDVGLGVRGCSGRFSSSGSEPLSRQCRHRISLATAALAFFRRFISTRWGCTHAREINRRSGQLAESPGCSYSLPGEQGFPPLSIEPAGLTFKH